MSGHCHPHSVHHDPHHHVDYYAAARHAAQVRAHRNADHHKINSLQCSVSDLIKHRNELACIGSKTASQAAELRAIEEELRLSEAELLKQLAQQERDATASHEELKSSLKSIQGLLEVRENDLAKQKLETCRLTGLNEVLDMKNHNLDQENQRLHSVYSETKASADSRYRAMDCEFADLKKRVAHLHHDLHHDVHHDVHHHPVHHHDHHDHHHDHHHDVHHHDVHHHDVHHHDVHHPVHHHTSTYRSQASAASAARSQGSPSRAPTFRSQASASAPRTIVAQSQLNGTINGSVNGSVAGSIQSGRLNGTINSQRNGTMNSRGNQGTINSRVPQGTFNSQNSHHSQCASGCKH